MTSEVLEQGISAFQAGDRERARELLLQAVELEPGNENAWYYLAAAETDPERREVYLRRVLEINPANERAADVLSRLQTRHEEAETDAWTRTPRVTPIRPLDGAASDIPGGADEGGFVLPGNIPGAPPQATFQSLINGGIALLRAGFDVLLRKPGAFESEIVRATWWRFWLLVGFVVAITAFLSLISGTITQARLASLFPRIYSFNIFTVVLSALISIPVGLATAYVASWASHQWAQRQGGRIPLYQHAYSVALVWMPASLISAAITLLFSLVGGGGIIGIVVTIYALYVMGVNFGTMYRFADPNQRWFTAAMAFVGVLVLGLILGLILAPLALGSILMFGI